MNSVMYEGKTSTAERIVYGAFDIIEGKTKSDPLSVFKSALENVAPAIEVRSRRVGGATYQVPVEVRTERRQALAIRWLITAARGRNDKTMVERLSAELMDVASGAFSEYEGRDATGKITLSELSYHPARHEKQRISALLGATGCVMMNWGHPENTAVPFGSV